VNPGILGRAALVGLPAGTGFLASLNCFLHRRTLAALLCLGGTSALNVVVATHVAEAMSWLPWMRWGAPDSVGHYLDLTSASLAVAFMLAALGASVARRVK
jgi:hypothetical protein